MTANEYEWIRTADRLPPLNTPILAYCGIFGRYIAVYERIPFSDKGLWTNSLSRGNLPPEWWMPLPKPPDICL